MIVRTVLGDIAPEALGVTYAHEHLIIDSPLVEANWPHIHLPSAETAVEEARFCAAAGVGSMLDAMPTGSGRNLEKLVEVSEQSGVNVIATTGMHTARYYQGVAWVADSPEDLALRFIPEVLEGVDGVRAGVMKVAMAGERASGPEESLFLAAGLVHIATDVPILTHCEEGRGALEQIQLLVGAGVEPDRILLSHTDKVNDRGYHREIMDSGASVAYDQALRQHLTDSSDTASLIVDMWESGFGYQMLLGTDGARRTLWSSLGGEPGLSWLVTDFPRKLRDHGLGDSEIETMFTTNPSRILSFTPPQP
jgi:5-phospho-D-xylono-1,4-lactonase